MALQLNVKIEASPGMEYVFKARPKSRTLYQVTLYQAPYLPPPVPAYRLLPRPMVPVDSLTAGNDGGTPPGSGQPADHPRDGSQLLHRPWTARNGRYLPQGPKDQVAREKFFHHSPGMFRMAALAHATALSSSRCKAEISPGEKGHLQTDF